MKPSIPEKRRRKLFAGLSKANKDFQQLYPGDRSERQPVHTVYGGANLFKSTAAEALGKRALENLNSYAPDFITFGKAFGLTGAESLEVSALDVITHSYESLSAEEKKKNPARLSYEVYHKVKRKLETEAIEDFRIDFEDGYGNRADAEEDQTAMEAATEVAKGMAENTLPPFIGIRIKPFTEEMRERGLRTLDLFITTLVKKSGGKLPENFVVMLPKVTIPEQPETLAACFDFLERELRLQKRCFKNGNDG